MKTFVMKRIGGSHTRWVRGAIVGIGAAMVLTMAGCGSDDSGTTNASSATPAPAAPAGTPGDVTKGVTDAYVNFFDGKTTADKKIALVEDGSQFAQTINAQASSPMATGTTATVINVKEESPDSASVIYTVSINGTPALQNQEGYAVKVDGQWKVAAKSFCALLTMEGNPPPVCAKPAQPTPTS